MPRHALADADTPFSQRAIDGFRYPLGSGARLTLIAVTLLEALSFLPVTGLKLLVIFIGWMAIYVYAFECLRHTADGFADPPELALNTEDSTGVALILIQLTGNALAVLAPFFLGIPGLLVSLVFAFVLPVITMSLTFDGVGAALNPANWVAAIARFGPSYLLHERSRPYVHRHARLLRGGQLPDHLQLSSHGRSDSPQTRDAGLFPFVHRAARGYRTR
jgi:hypothetical protein